ncbi:unnamed protein product [Dicrocoelium dendriticum]|nr:unnamed protein product [Dicrocoelium dendriticum]
MQLVSAIVANIMDAVVRVLKVLHKRGTQFEDTSLRELAIEWIETQPVGGFLSKLLQTTETQSIRNDLRRSSCVWQPGFLQSTQFTPKVRISVSTDQVRARDEKMSQATVPTQILENNTAYSLLRCGENRSPANENAFLQDALLRIIQYNESVPPSLMKKVEQMGKTEVIEWLKADSLDIGKLMLLYSEVGDTPAAEMSVGLPSDLPPSTPSASPPLSYEDELLASIVAEKEVNSASSQSLTSENSQNPSISNSLININGSSAEAHFVSKAGYLHKKNSSPENILNIDSAEVGKNSDTLSSARQVQTMELNVFRNTKFDGSPECFLGSRLKATLKLFTEEVHVQEMLYKQNCSNSELMYADLYFLKHVDRLIQDDYVPTLQDILVMRQPSNAIGESVIRAGQTTVRYITLPEGGSKIRKYLHYFESVNVVIFLVSLSDCFRSLHNREPKYELQATVDLFETLVVSPYLRRKDFIVFFNKMDQLRQEMMSTMNQSDCEGKHFQTSWFQFVKP